MYILFEKSNARSTDDIINWDCMGYTDSEELAINWRNDNKEYREYKYCPKVVLK